MEYATVRFPSHDTRSDLHWSHRHGFGRRIRRCSAEGVRVTARPVPPPRCTSIVGSVCCAVALVAMNAEASPIAACIAGMCAPERILTEPARCFLDAIEPLASILQTSSRGSWPLEAPIISHPQRHHLEQVKTCCDFSTLAKDIASGRAIPFANSCSSAAWTNSVLCLERVKTIAVDLFLCFAIEHLHDDVRGVATHAAPT